MEAARGKERKKEIFKLAVPRDWPERQITWPHELLFLGINQSSAPFQLTARSYKSVSVTLLRYNSLWLKSKFLPSEHVVLLTS